MFLTISSSVSPSSWDYMGASLLKSVVCSSMTCFLVFNYGPSGFLSRIIDIYFFLEIINSLPRALSRWIIVISMREGGEAGGGAVGKTFQPFPMVIPSSVNWNFYIFVLLILDFVEVEWCRVFLKWSVFGVNLSAPPRKFHYKYCVLKTRCQFSVKS